MDRESVHSSGSGKKLVKKTIGSAPVPVGGDDILSQAKQEEWTTSRKVVNHKTKQVETRVQRQIIMEDGKVIADSGPQVTTKVKEDNKQEESENTNHRNTGDIDALPPPGYTSVPGGNQVVSEKTETHQSMREAKEENMQYHDESLKELTGLEVHRKALQAPNDLIKIDTNESPDRPKGKLVHYSSKSHKINDSEEMKETSRLGRDGKLTTESTHTHQHEEFDDDEVPEDNTEVKALPAASTETTRNLEYLKDYEHGFDNFPKAMNQQYPSNRAIEIDKPDYDREETKKSSSHNQEHSKNTTTTSRWLDDHFGDSDESDIIETSGTRTGKNVINVSKTGRTATPISAFAGEQRSIDRSRNVSRTQKLSKQSSPQKYTSTATYYVKDSRTPSPQEYYVRPSSQFKEDASVQASLSDEDEGRLNDFRNTNYTSTTERKEKLRSSDFRSETPNRPEKSYYFGDENLDRNRNYINKKNTERSAYNTSIERESKIDSKSRNEERSKGFVSANVQTKVLSSLNDKIVNDSATNESFEKSFKNQNERSDVKQSLNLFMDKHTQNLNEDFWSTKSKPQPLEYIHPVIQDDRYSARRDASTRQRTFDSFTTSPPLYSSKSDYYSNGFSQNKDYKYNYSSSPSPPSSPTGGTWTKSRGRAMSPIYRSNSPNDKFPEFSPLLSPLEIKNFTESYTNTRSHS